LKFFSLPRTFYPPFPAAFILQLQIPTFLPFLSSVVWLFGGCAAETKERCDAENANAGAVGRQPLQPPVALIRKPPWGSLHRNWLLIVAEVNLPAAGCN